MCLWRLLGLRGLSQSPAMGPEPGCALWEALEAIGGRSLQNRHAPCRISEDTSGPPSELAPHPLSPSPGPSLRHGCCRSESMPGWGQKATLRRALNRVPAREDPPPTVAVVVGVEPGPHSCRICGPARPECDPQPGAGPPGTESAGRAGMTGCCAAARPQRGRR